MNAYVKPFSAEQKYFIQTGEKNAKRLSEIVQSALGVVRKKVEVKRHTWIYSPPGAGKTFTVQTTADNFGVEPLKIQGASSLNALVIRIATYVHSIPTGPLYVG